jgi:hypothetical protein
MKKSNAYKNFIKQLDIEDDDKCYFMRVRKNKDGKLNLHRLNDGFHIFELIGIMEMAQQEILQQMNGELEPEIIEKKLQVIK